MKKKTVCFVIVLMLVGLTCLSAQMSKSQLQEMYVSHLRSVGYSPSIDRDGDVNFTEQGLNFYIAIDNDPQSFRLSILDHIDIGGASNRLKALEAASAVTRSTRVVRLYITQSGKIAVDSFIFVAKPEDFKVHFSQLVKIMVDARKEFVDAMR